MTKASEFIIANWKMQLTVDQAIAQATKLKKLLAKAKFDKEIEIVIAPDFLSWAAVAEIFKGTKIAMGAQDGWYEPSGSFTGEISLKMLKNLGCQYVILGHSERREFLKETDKLINKKIAAALEYDLVPIVCIGETFQQRKEGRKEIVIMQQVQQALHGIDIKPDQTLIVAYEPVWVIGSGQAIDPAEAAHTAMIIKQSLIDVLEDRDLPLVKVIYGGSVNAASVNSFTKLNEIEGALVGSASLKAEDFVKLIQKV